VCGGLPAFADDDQNDARARIRDVSQPTSPTWSDIAPWYDELVQAGSGPHETALKCTLGLLGEVRGLRVLDLACGQGLASRALAEAGAAEVIGVDSSSAMLEIAVQHGGSGTLRYVRDDAQVLSSVEDESFDAVTCQLGLMDIPDLAATLTAVRRVLRKGGVFAFVIGHPCFLAPNAVTLTDDEGHAGRWIGDYFSERFWRSQNPQGVRRAGNHHRMLSTYLNALAEHGFAIQRSEEPRASDLLATQQPEYGAVPIFFGARCHKTTTRAD
jgi:ubiquinone/menaquinone biosynthesis C-methylase UbiE